MNLNKSLKGGEPLMTSTGAPIDEKLNSLSAGERGPLLLQVWM